MNKYSIIAIVLVTNTLCFLAGGHFLKQDRVAFGDAQSDLAAEQAAKVKVMAAYFISEERLKETPTVDLALGTSQQWSSGYVQAANDLGINTLGLSSPVLLSVLMRTKLGLSAMLCSNPHSVVTNPKATDVATPQ